MVLCSAARFQRLAYCQVILHQTIVKILMISLISSVKDDGQNSRFQYLTNCLCVLFFIPSKRDLKRKSALDPMNDMLRYLGKKPKTTMETKPTNQAQAPSSKVTGVGIQML